MKFSFIVPVYNAGTFLPDCIHSLLKQTYKNFEILLINDGSTDNSGEICDDFALQYPSVQVFHRENAGVSAARNYGIQRAGGDYLCFVDADDMVSPVLLETAETQNGKADLLLFGYTRKHHSQLCRNSLAVSTIIDSNGRQALIDKTVYDDGTKYNGINCNTVWSKLYKTSILKEHQIVFPEGIKIAEDKLFNFSFFQQCRDIRYIDGVFYYCRTHKGSVTMSRMPDCFSVSSNSVTLFKAAIQQVPDKHLQARYNALCVLEGIPSLRNCLALEFCHADNHAPYKNRKAAYQAAMGTELVQWILQECDYSRLKRRDRFYYQLYRKRFFWIDLLMRHRVLRGGAMLLARPFL